ncbi:MAG: polysaccharide deacetylase family protein [Verrucomicrobiia bacterium]
MRWVTDYSALLWACWGGGAGALVRHGPEEAGGWAFTFDDGPERGATEAVAEALEAVGGRGTFFVIGEKVRRNRVLVRELVERGHQVGSHSMTHARCSRLKRVDLVEELVGSKRLIEDVTGVEVRWFRPPFGALRAGQVEVVMAAGMRVALWNVNPKDWMGAGPEVLAGRLARARVARPLVVMHDRLETVGRALRLFFERRPEVRSVVLG